MEFLCFRGHSILWGIITFLMEPLRDLGKSRDLGKWSSFIWGVYEGSYHCEIWENLNGVPSLGGFTRELYSCLKGASDEYSHGPMRSTVGNINWGKSTHGEQWTNGSLQSRFGKIWRKVVYSSCPRETMYKICPVLVWSMSDLQG